MGTLHVKVQTKSWNNMENTCMCHSLTMRRVNLLSALSTAYGTYVWLSILVCFLTSSVNLFHMQHTDKEKWSLHCKAAIHCSKRNYFRFLRGTRENQWKCTHAKHTGNTVWKLKKSQSVRIILLLFGHSVVSESLDPTDCSTPAFPGLHYLPEFA